MTSAAARTEMPASLPSVTGEFAFSMNDFREIARLVKSGSGIDLPESKATLVYSRLIKRLRAKGLASFKAYCDLVRSDVDERHQMIAALTTNVTRFFREPHHFSHLRDNIIKPLASAARRGERIRLWSAACSTGEEPYSMALTVLSVLPEAPRLDIRVLATDLNPFVVEYGRQGLYEAESIKNIPHALHSRWTEPGPRDDSQRFKIAEDARSLVSFRELNLLGNWPMKGEFQAIFCRNVVIYFDRQTQSKLWDRFEKKIATGGALYIGHSERLSDEAARAFAPDGITTYIKQRG